MISEKKYYLAIDIGASSGRHIIGWWEDGEIKTDRCDITTRFVVGTFSDGAGNQCILDVLRSDCHRQSVYLDSLRGAQPLASMEISDSLRGAQPHPYE